MVVLITVRVPAPRWVMVVVELTRDLKQVLLSARLAVVLVTAPMLVPPSATVGSVLQVTVWALVQVAVLTLAVVKVWASQRESREVEMREPQQPVPLDHLAD